MKKGALLVVLIAIAIFQISCGIGISKQPTDDGDIALVARKDFASSKPNESEEFNELPTYTIIEEARLQNGGIHGSILITSFSKVTPISIRESVLKRIAVKEGYLEASLYCTLEAYQANLSSSYAETHPNAFKEGYLGSLKEGKFTRTI